MSAPRVVFVVAMAANRVIGQDGAMPWRLPSDLARFKQITMGKPMVMGRRTFESIGRALPGRDSIVLTRARDWTAPGTARASSIEEALALAVEAAARRGAGEIAVIGGAEIFSLAMPYAARIYLTEVAARPTGDTRMPAWGSDWRVAERAACSAGPGDSAGTAFLVLERDASPPLPLPGFH